MLKISSSHATTRRVVSDFLAAWMLFFVIVGAPIIAPRGTTADDHAEWWVGITSSVLVLLALLGWHAHKRDVEKFRNAKAYRYGHLPVFFLWLPVWAYFPIREYAIWWLARQVERMDSTSLLVSQAMEEEWYYSCSWPDQLKMELKAQTKKEDKEAQVVEAAAGEGYW